MKRITKKLFNPDLHKASDAIDSILNEKTKSGERHLILLPHGIGAGVSSFCSLKILKFICSRKNGRALVLTKDTDVVRQCMELFLWDVNLIGCASELKVSMHSRNVTNRKTGAQVYFRGLDELPDFKRKGESSIIGPVSILLFESSDKFEREDVASIVCANMFCGYGFGNSVALLSFNTPTSKSHWINRKVELSKKAMRKHGTKSLLMSYHADYRHVPKEWLGESFFEHVKTLKKRYPDLYRSEYLGQAIEK